MNQINYLRSIIDVISVRIDQIYLDPQIWLSQQLVLVVFLQRRLFVFNESATRLDALFARVTKVYVYLLRSTKGQARNLGSNGISGSVLQ
jgi:hypothetical protein